MTLKFKINGVIIDRAVKGCNRYFLITLTNKELLDLTVVCVREGKREEGREKQRNRVEEGKVGNIYITLKKSVINNRWRDY